MEKEKEREREREREREGDRNQQSMHRPARTQQSMHWPTTEHGLAHASAEDASARAMWGHRARVHGSFSLSPGRERKRERQSEREREKEVMSVGDHPELLLSAGEAAAFCKYSSLAKTCVVLSPQHACACREGLCKRECVHVHRTGETYTWRVWQILSVAGLDPQRAWSGSPKMM